MKSRTAFAKAVIITAIVTAGCLGIAAVIGVTTAGFVPGRLTEGGTPVDQTRSVPADGVTLILVDSVSDDIKVVEGTGDAILARLHGTVGTSAPDALPRLSAERTGSTADIRLDRKRRFTLGIPWNRLALEVSVPRGYKGKLDVRSVSADLEVADHAYDALVLRTTSGDLAVRAVNARQVAATSVSGSVTIGAAAMPDRLDVQSTSGDVTLRLPADASFMLDARSTSGDVTCRFPIVVDDRRSGGGSHVLAGKVGTGAGLVTARTVSGSIRVTP